MNNRALGSTSILFQNPLTKQRGSVLVISLLVMLVITVIGISGMQNSMMEEKMAGGMRDKHNAFQAAEAALKRAQQFLKPVVGTAGFDGTGGLYASTDPDPDVWDINTWSNANSISYTDPITNMATPAPFSNVFSQPRFIIKHVDDIPISHSSMTIGGYGSTSGAKVTNFKVIARGIGREFGSVVILEAYFGKVL